MNIKGDFSTGGRRSSRGPRRSGGCGSRARPADLDALAASQARKWRLVGPLGPPFLPPGLRYWVYGHSGTKLVTRAVIRIDHVARSWLDSTECMLALRLIGVNSSPWTSPSPGVAPGDGPFRSGAICRPHDAFLCSLGSLQEQERGRQPAPGLRHQGERFGSKTPSIPASKHAR